MKKWFVFTLLTAVVSCGIEEIGRRPADGDGVWIRPGVDMDSVAVDDRTVYVTAMEYFDRYDWRADPGKGTVKCSLAVYLDGVPMMKIPVGDKYEVSSDPESHWMLEGHLYTCYVSDSVTVIKRDGKPLVRYSGREIICGIAVHGGSVYTLGDNIGGDGFSYRKDGEILLGRSKGMSFGYLYHEGDNISFAYREQIVSEEETFERYYFVRNGDVRQAALREDVKKVWDIVPYKGDICFLASVVGVPSPVLFTPDSMQALSLSSSANLLDAKILHENETLYVEGVIDRENAEITSVLWRSSGIIYTFANGMTVSSSCMDADGICCVLNPSPPYNKGVIYMSGESFPMPEGCAVIGSRTAAIFNGIPYIGLSSLSGDSPILWTPDRSDTLKINGFITSVSTNRY